MPIPQFNTEGVLICPNCGGEYLHHHDVEIFDRREDERSGMHLTLIAQDGEVTIDKNMAGNPSPRRHGLTIGFTCEECGDFLSLDIWQHKGNTLMRLKIVESP